MRLPFLLSLIIAGEGSFFRELSQRVRVGTKTWMGRKWEVCVCAHVWSSHKVEWEREREVCCGKEEYRG